MHLLWNVVILQLECAFQAIGKKVIKQVLMFYNRRLNSVNLEVSILMAFQETWVACCLSKGVKINMHSGGLYILA